MEIGFVSLATGLYLTFIFSKKMYFYFCNYPNANQKTIAIFCFFGWVIVAFGVLNAVNSDFFTTMGPIEGLMFIVMMNFGALFIMGFLMCMGLISRFEK